VIFRNRKYEFNGLKLPDSIINRIKNNTWNPPSDLKNFKNLILSNCPFENEKPELEKDCNDFTLYDLELMDLETKAMTKWPKTRVDENERSMFLGKKDGFIFPGDIDVNKSIIIADLGFGSDTPIVLDYRVNELIPSVNMLYYGEDCMFDNRWKMIASSFEEFEKILFD